MPNLFESDGQNFSSPSLRMIQTTNCHNSQVWLSEDQAMFYW